MTVAAAAAGMTALAGCATGTENTGSGEMDKPVVLTTFTVLQDIAQNVAGDHLTVESITKPGAEIHGYEPTPKDIAKASDADLILDNGLNLELWFARFVDEIDVPHVVVSDGVPAMDITEDAYAGKPNPHAWMSPTNVQIYVDNMVEAFTELDPEGATEYEANGAAYKVELQGVQDELVTALSELPENQRALVSCEGAFSYLAADAGLTEKYLWAVNSDGNPSAARVADVATFVKEQQVPAVFCETTVPADTMRQVAAESGATYAGELYVDSLSQGGGDVPTYLDLIRHDAEVIARALGQ